MRLTIRGFGARGQGDRSNAATIRGIKVLVDGFPETEPDGRTSLDIIDLTAANRIEVIRSNASTLFGNASGGVVNVETTPWFVDPYFEVHAITGAFGLRKTSLAGGTLVGEGRLSLNLSRTVNDGWRTHSGTNSTQLGSSFVFTATEATRISLLLSAASNRYDIPGPLTRAQFGDDPSQANPQYHTRRERRYNRVARLGVKSLSEVDASHTVEVLAYLTPKFLERSERNTYRDFTRLHFGGGAVYRWHPEELPWQLTAGADAATQDGAILFYNLVGGDRGDSLRTNKREAASAVGGFVQGEWRALPSLSLVAGGRFDRQVYVSQDFPAGRRMVPREARLVFEHFTPTVAALYRISANHSAYLRIGGGLETPAFNEVDPPPSIPDARLNPLLKPMTSTTVEVGAREFLSFRAHRFSVLFRIQRRPIASEFAMRLFRSRAGHGSSRPVGRSAWGSRPVFTSSCAVVCH